MRTLDMTHPTMSTAPIGPMIWSASSRMVVVLLAHQFSTGALLRQPLFPGCAR